MSATITDHLISMLKNYAQQEAWTDDENFLLPDFVGSNIYDAYEGGNKDGHIELARHLLTALQIKYK